MSQPLLQKKVETLEASLSTLDYQIKNLSVYYSALQVRCWRIHRRKVKRQLEFFKAALQNMMDARKVRRAQKVRARVSPLAPSYGHQELMESEDSRD